MQSLMVGEYSILRDNPVDGGDVYIPLQGGYYTQDEYAFLAQEEGYCIPTQAQSHALECIAQNWHSVGPLTRVYRNKGCGQTYAVQCFYADGRYMWVCIEPDGHAHS